MLINRTSIELRSHYHRILLNVWSNFAPNFGQCLVEIWSNLAPIMIEFWSNFDRKSLPGPSWGTLDVQRVRRDDLERPRRALGVPWERPGSVRGASSEALSRTRNLNEFRNPNFDRILNTLNQKMIGFYVDRRALLHEFWIEMWLYSTIHELNQFWTIFV